MLYAPSRYRHYGKNVQIFEYCTILKPEVIELHDGARVDARCRLEGGEGLILGENTHIASGSCLNVGGGRLIFGAHSGCSCNVVIASGMTDFTMLHVTPQDGNIPIRETTVIGEYVVLFASVVVLPGVEIGEGAIVGAGSVVTRDVAPWTVVAGSPARFVKMRETVCQR